MCRCGCRCNQCCGEIRAEIRSERRVERSEREIALDRAIRELGENACRENRSSRGNCCSKSCCR